MASEEAPLLPRTERQAQAPSSRSTVVHQARLAYLIIPVICGTRFVAVLTSTPKIQVIRDVSCRWWLVFYAPEALPLGVIYPPAELCSESSVEKAFSVAISTLAVIDAFGGMVSSSIISHCATRYGRKPVILVLTSLVAISTACFIAAMSAHGALQNVLLLAWIIIGAFCGPMAFSLVCNMYVVDTTEQHKRTFVFNVADGFAVLGTAPTYWLGGHISQQSNVVTVFWWKLFAIAPIVLYILAFLPESFSSGTQAAALPNASPLAHGLLPGPPLAAPAVLSWRPLDAVASMFAPFKILRPSSSQRGVSGRRDSRPLIIALSQFLNTLGSDYVGNAFVSYTSVRFHIDADHLAIALSGFAVSQVIWLSVVVPAILRLGRPLDSERRQHPCSQEEIETQSEDASRLAASRFDIYLAVVSSMLGALASTVIGLAPSSPAVIAALIMFSLGTGHDPTTRSIVVASVDPLQSDQALSALTILSSMGALLAPLIFGSILSSQVPSHRLATRAPLTLFFSTMLSTILQFPQLVFFFCSVTIVCSGMLLLLARDSDPK